MMLLLVTFGNASLEVATDYRIYGIGSKGSVLIVPMLVTKAYLETNQVSGLGSIIP